MNFDFSGEQKQLRDSARRFLADRCPREAVRAILEGPEAHDAALWKALGEMGFLGAAAPEAFGGQGAGYLALCVISEELGRALAPVPMCSSIYQASEFLILGGSEAQKARWLPRLATGAAIGAFAFAEGPGRLAPDAVGAVARSGRLTGRKWPVADGAMADVAVVAANDAAGRLSLWLVELAQKGVRREPLPSIDPTRAYARLDFANAEAEPLGEAGQGGPLVTQVLDRAAVLVAFEQLGGADAALEMARGYALERMAFGRPIGSFQAIKHMLADMYVAATLARSNAYYAAWALSTGSPELPVAAAAARVSATAAYQQCARNNIQVHGGMGFTWEYDCHLHYRRSNALALELGPLSMWEDLLISRIAEDRAREAA